MQDSPAMPPTEQGRFESKPMPASTMYPRTRYFEIDSVHAGARYAVWITTPKAYEFEPERSFPTVVSPDGNRGATFCADTADLCEWDYMDSYESTIQVSIGYTDDDANRALAVRARDLLPPNEHVRPESIEGMRQASAVGRVLDREGIDLYIHYLQHPAGDRFLAFIEQELLPFLAANYRIDANRLGLFGHSYGGLFSTYAALQPETKFRHFGASSPGILSGKSEVFRLYAEALARGELSDRDLLMAVATREVTESAIYQSLVGGGTAEFMCLTGSQPVRGLAFKGDFITHESHITVKPVAFFRFLRAFFVRRSGGDEVKQG